MTERRILHDISPLLSPRTAVWPGDTPLSREMQLELSKGHSVELSTLHATVHIGAHADAPGHFAQEGGSIADVDLSAYIGPCFVMHVTKEDLRLCGETRTQIIDISRRRDDIQKIIPANVHRLLFRTNSQPSPEVFPEDFVAIAPETIDQLGRMGFVLVGIDTPSVDPFASKSLPSHHALLRFNMRNLEGLDLRQVPEGIYELIALPLRLQGFDASPVRAVLRQLN